jgi:pimeloyl-ACP methyl ester carboxylesterase
MSMSGPTAQAWHRIDDLPEVVGIEHRYIDAGGLRVHVAEAGDGPPVLLLHGWPQHWYMWRDVIERLAPQFRLIAPDLRGFGWTEAPGEGYDLETFAADQVALLDALEIESASIIGHDWGGFTCFLLGLGAPERIERMVALNTPHPWAAVNPRLLLQAWRSWYAAANALPVLGPRLSQSGRIAAWMLSHGNVNDPFPEGAAIYLDRLRDSARAQATASLYRYYMRAFAQAPRSPYRGERLSVPTLLLFGERDLFISPDLLEGGEMHADDLRIELVPDAGHFIANERPDLVARRALAFLS